MPVVGGAKGNLGQGRASERGLESPRLPKPAQGPFAAEPAPPSHAFPDRSAHPARDQGGGRAGGGSSSSTSGRGRAFASQPPITPAARAGGSRAGAGRQGPGDLRRIGPAPSRGGSSRGRPLALLRAAEQVGVSGLARVFGGGQGQDGARPAPLAAESPCPAQGSRPGRSCTSHGGGEGAAEPGEGGPRAQAAEADGAGGAPGTHLDSPGHGADAVPEPGTSRGMARGPPGARLPGAARGGAQGPEEPLLPFPGTESQAGRPRQRRRPRPSGQGGHLPAADRQLGEGARPACRAPGTGWPRSRGCAESEPRPGGSGRRGGPGRAAAEGGGAGGGRRAAPANRLAEGPRGLRQRWELPLPDPARPLEGWRCGCLQEGEPVMYQGRPSFPNLPCKHPRQGHCGCLRWSSKWYSLSTKYICIASWPVYFGTRLAIKTPRIYLII